MNFDSSLSNGMPMPTIELISFPEEENGLGLVIQTGALDQYLLPSGGGTGPFAISVAGGFAGSIKRRKP